MLNIDKSTVSFTNTLDTDCHVMFKSAATNFEYNSFYCGASSTVQFDLEYFLYPSTVKIQRHSLQGYTYTIEHLQTIHVNECCIINDIHCDLKLIDAVIDCLRYKKNTLVHYNYTKDNIPAYRLSKIWDVFNSGCSDILGSYFFADDFFSMNHSKFLMCLL